MAKKTKPKKSKHDGTNKNKAGYTPMQEAFILHYVNDPQHNATKAAKNAGFSEATAGQQGYQLLQIPSIRKAIETKLEERYDTLDISGNRILREIAKIAFGNLKQVATWSENTLKLIDSKALSEDDAALLKSISVSESSSSSDKSDSSSTSISFQVFDKLKALELLAKNKKLLTDKIKLDGRVKVTLEDLITGAGQEEDDE